MTPIFMHKQADCPSLPLCESVIKVLTPLTSLVLLNSLMKYVSSTCAGREGSETKAEEAGTTLSFSVVLGHPPLALSPGTWVQISS